MRGGRRLVLIAIAAVMCWPAPAWGQSTGSPPITIPDVEGVRGAVDKTSDSIGAVITSLGSGSGQSGGNGDGGSGSGGGGGNGTNGRGGGSSGGVGGGSSGGEEDVFTGPLAQGTPDPNCVFCDPDEFELGGFDGSPPPGPPTPPAPPSSGGGPPAAPPRSPAQIAYEVSQRTPLPPPAVRTSPPVGSDQLVNLPTWMWVDDWSPRTASASEGGLIVTVTATPRAVVWRMGDGSEVVCGRGTAWNPALREEQQSSDCTHTYLRSSAHQPGLAYFATSTLVWDATWTASNGESGSLGSASRTTEFRMRVAEGQAVVIG